MTDDYENLKRKQKQEINKIKEEIEQTNYKIS